MGFGFRCDQDLTVVEKIGMVCIWGCVFGLPLALLGATTMVVAKLSGASGLFFKIPVVIGGLLMTPTFLGACGSLLGSLTQERPGRYR